MNLLVCCEESQTVCKAFLEKGVNAFSCDIKPCSGGLPDRHLQGDCKLYIESPELIGINHWDIIIAHPPCTYLSKAGACNNQRDPTRIEKGFSAAQFFYYFYNLDVPMICIENPVPQKIFGLPPYSQSVQPYNFGDPYSKLTLLWLKGLPPLIPTVAPYDEYVSWCKVHRSPTIRSKTFLGIAQAMADQWSFYEK